MANSNKLKYPVVRNMPVASFYYQGHHTHPIRRTVLVTQSSSTTITGYELREGATIRPFNKAPVKSYSREKIASFGQCGRRLRKRTPKKMLDNSTLTRKGLLELLTDGI